AMYMATLYYYDLSGALVKTVPPKGVRTLSNTDIQKCKQHRERPSVYRDAVYPNHILTTTYQYTSFGAVAEKKSPDEGTTKYAYDFAGRNILSRNAVQSANNHASYVLYDANNRIIESGRTNFSGSWQTFKPYSAHSGGLSGQAEVTTTLYDEPSTLSSYFNGGQKRLRNRPSSVSYKAGSIASASSYVAAYSYDALGNVTRMVQHYPSLGLSDGKDVKTSDYTFDKLSGQITRIVYQPGKEDQFIHWLSYDANKRVTQVQTSTSEYTPECLRDVDAKFFYYQHGPLARIEIGNEKIQGVDYAYTIQGWLKGINSYTTGNGDVDMGKDGTEDGGLHAAGFPKDVTAELLNYYPNNYKKIGAEGAQFYPESPVAVLNSGFSKPLYNGNIQNSMMSVLHGFSEDTRKTFAQAYSYDQANRIRQSKMLFGSEAGFEAAFSNQYSMEVDYDLNGNITKLSRSGNAGTLFDDLTYGYNNPDNNNRLHYITDLGTNGATDLQNQTNTYNYGYDAIGRLTSDNSENISNIQYNTQSKVTAVNKAGSNTTYAYDAFGRRISKTNGTGTEWYVNDALGNPMAIYSINGSEVRWKEAAIYGGKRMGIYKPDVVLSSNNVMRDSTIRGNKSYELANHIGDVLAVVSDRKLNTADGLAAEVQAAHNYFPFGMVMPGRTFGNDEYRYGFQGMESEDNLRGENNSYTTEFRQYDPRVGRWMSVDPMADKFASLSPYVSFFNNPNLVIDPKGDDPPTINDLRTYERSHRIEFGVMISIAVERDGETSIESYRMGDALPEGVTSGEYDPSIIGGFIHQLTDDRDPDLIAAERNSYIMMNWQSMARDVAEQWMSTVGETLDNYLEHPDPNLSEADIERLTNFRHALTAGTLLIGAHGVAENTATLLDGIANFDALSRAEDSGRDPGSLFAARVRALDQIVSSTMGLAGAVGIEFGGVVEDVVGSGHFMQDVARTIYSSIYRLEDEDLRREMDSYRQLERGLCRSGVCR
ncbi:MAG: hypothetical protein KA841_05040, partial [Chitinophagales bacterium]|nr:hypothetical protein [Chitinophagales bacterium]